MRIRTFFIICSLSCALASCASSATDSVATAEKNNKERTELVNPDNSKFLVEMADARMMDYEEGRLAAEKGISPRVRNYGKKMMKDQELLLQDLADVARLSRVTLPDRIGDNKRSGLNDLKKLSGRQLDKKFLVMIQRDHERDVKEFKNVKTSEYYPADDNVAQFVNKRLPLIEKHLDEVKAIRKSY